jgi:hypothetical protein
MYRGGSSWGQKEFGISRQKINMMEIKGKKIYCIK